MKIKKKTAEPFMRVFVKEDGVIKNSPMFIMANDPESGGIWPADQGEFVPTHVEMLEIIAGLEKFYAFYSDDEINEHNEKLYNRYFGEERIPVVKSYQVPRQPVAGYVYLFANVEKDLYKIGLSKKPTQRLAQFQQHTTDEIKMLHFVAVADMRKTEEALHLRFADQRVKGEWFSLSFEQRAWFCSLNSEELDKMVA